MRAWTWIREKVVAVTAFVSQQDVNQAADAYLTAACTGKSSRVRLHVYIKGTKTWATLEEVGLAAGKPYLLVCVLDQPLPGHEDKECSLILDRHDDEWVPRRHAYVYVREPDKGLTRLGFRPRREW